MPSGSSVPRVLRVLGSVEVHDPDAARRLGTGQAREVLAFLAAQRRRPVSTTDIVDALWPAGPPATAVTIVHGAVRRIRQALGADTVVHGEAGYHLALADDHVDLWAVEALVEAGDHQQARALWHDPPFGPYAERHWARAAVDETVAVLRPPREDLGGRRSQRRVPVTRLVGRRRELAMVLAAQRRSRLVTIVGLGGVGKTRLALEAVREQALDEVTHVDVAAAVGPSASRLVTELGQPPSGDVDVDLRTAASLIGRRRQLLVLDGCEHDAQGSARLVEHLLARCPELSVLAASRSSLGVPGEHVVPLVPFDHPGDSRGEAVELLLDRAQALGLAVTAADRARAAQICERCAGVPLAIELAAGELIFDLGGAESGVDASTADNAADNPAVSPGAAVSRAVEAAIAGLSDGTRATARRAALLVAGFTPDLMATLHGPGGPTLGVLHELLGSGLVVAETGRSSRRLRFLDPVRESLLSHTPDTTGDTTADTTEDATGDTSAAADLAATQAALTAHLAAVRPHVGQPPSIPRLAAAIGELANVECMIDLLTEAGCHAERLALVTAAGHTWRAEGHWVTGAQHIEAALAAAPDAAPLDRAHARCVQVFVASTFDATRRLVPALIEAATIAQEEDDPALEGVLRMHLVNGLGYAGRFGETAQHLDRLHTLVEATGSEYLALGARTIDGSTKMLMGDAEAGHRELSEVAVRLEAIGALSDAARLHRLASVGARKAGLIDVALADLDEAERLATDALARGTLATVRADIADLRFHQDPASARPPLTAALEAALGIGNLRSAGILRTRLGTVGDDPIITAQGALDLWPVDHRWAAASVAHLLDRLPAAHPLQRLAPPVIARLAQSWGAPLDAHEADVVAHHAADAVPDPGDEAVLEALWALATDKEPTPQTV